ncbi:MAG: TolB family protein [Byssovorax sp.]
MRTMRTWTTLAMLSALPFALSCSTSPLGQIVLAIRTDISIPKDIDKIVIDVSLAETGAVKYHVPFAALDPDRTFKLPATLAFTASEEDPGAAVRVRVLASRGDEAPRMIRDVITTVPADRVVTLPIAIEFLCDGTAEMVTDAAGKPVRDAVGDLVFQSTCGEGRTCSAGKCVDATVPSATLAVYDETTIFGGGTASGDGDCFDAATCFDGATPAVVEMVDMMGGKVCRITAGNDVNVALVTQGAGMCGASGCFVPLDAESDSGWQPGPDGTLQLPPAVCEKLNVGAVTGVVTAPAAKSPCARKRGALPICGPFSSSGKYTPLNPSTPVVVASGQQNPVSLVVAETTTESRVYWTTRGTFDTSNNPKSDGTVKRAQITGEQAVEIASAQASPHDLVHSEDKGFVFWTNASGGMIMGAPLTTLSAKPLLGGLGQREGIAIDGATLVWTDLTSNQVSEALLAFDKDQAVAGAPKPLDQASLGAGPRRVVAASGLRCWTYEDKLDTQGGVVACNDGNASIAVATGQSTPRSLALVPDGKGQGTVYFASFADHTKGGGVFAVSTAGGAVKNLTQGHAGFPDGEDYPNGVAVDGSAVYWTSRTRGAVMRLEGGVLKEIADHQNNPGAIAVGTDAIYWVNEGTADQPDGAIVRIRK